MAAERLVVIGGDAAGMSAASQARRLKGPDELEIVAFERGHFTSYSACGIPYWVGGDVARARRPDRPYPRGAPGARHRPADAHRGDGDRPRRAAGPRPGPGQRDRDAGRASTSWSSRPGARPVRPPLPGHRRARGARGADPGRRPGAAGHAGRGRRGGARSSSAPATSASRWRRRCSKRGYEVTVLQPRRAADGHARPGHGPPGARGDGRAGHHDGDRRRGHQDPHRRRTAGSRAVATDGRRVPGGRGGARHRRRAGDRARPRGRPAARRARRAAHRPGDAGARPREHLGGRRLRGGPRPGLGPHRHIPLGTHANKHGQVIGANVGGGYAHLPGRGRHGGQQGLRPGDRPYRAAGEGRPRGGAAVRDGDDRVDQPRRLLPGRRADDGEDARGAPHGPAARRADRRPRGRGASAWTSRRSR